MTQAIPSGSPAMDAGDNATCLPTDQRGFVRPYPAGGTCDIGAFEIGPLRLSTVASPATDVPYHGLVTYTLVLSNTGGTQDPNVSLDDPLPTEVTFHSWVDQPANTTLTGSEIQWNGALNAGQALTWTFRIRHAGNYSDHVVNLARFSGSSDGGIGQANFDVENLFLYLPLVMR